MFISSDNGVHTWGWNEHGMCGTEDEENFSLPRRIRFLMYKRVRRTCIGVSAGGGQSFAWFKNIISDTDSDELE